MLHSLYVGVNADRARQIWGCWASSGPNLTLSSYSSDELEPPHVHVIRGGNEAKVWLEPVALTHNHGYNQRELNRVLDLVRTNQPDLLEMWHEHFG